MYYPFQFSTVITLFAGQINDGFSEYDLFFAIFDSIIDSMPEKEFRIPSGTTISRWFTGERTVPAALVKRCKASDAHKLIENEIKTHALKHFADIPKLIYQILKLIREDTNYTAPAKEQLLSYNPALEDNHASFLTDAILAALLTNQNIPFQKDGLLNHLLFPYIRPLGSRLPSTRPYFTGRRRGTLSRICKLWLLTFDYFPCTSRKLL